MKKQYIIQKYVMADSVAEALKKAPKTPIHEVFIHNGWFEKNMNQDFYYTEPRITGFDNG